MATARTHGVSLGQRLRHHPRVRARLFQATGQGQHPHRPPQAPRSVTFLPFGTRGIAGCVPFVLTNVPQSLLTYNCANPVYGITTHPLDATKTPGGSTGGEAALLAADGSVLGIGGDVGGSIRMPCHFTGMAGIKVSNPLIYTKSLFSLPTSASPTADLPEPFLDDH